jgi:HemY protein
VFHDMTDEPATRIAGLRGLYIEAEREGETEAARQIAERARAEAPSAAWAARALLRHQTAAGDWRDALATLSGAADARILDKRTARRQRAVILAGEALAREESDPDAARQAAFEANELAPDLVPAAVVAGRLAARQGDIRRATRVLEAAWKASPHPEIADAYLHVRAGDAASDRLKRAETLHRMRPQADEGRLALAGAAIDARDFSRAREALAPVLTQRPTRRALMLMAELEEAETGDRGRAREWLARAARAPRDPAWTADGVVLEHWAPISPLSGRIDAVEWKVPVAELEAPLDISAADLEPTPAAEEPEATVVTEVPPAALEPIEDVEPQPVVASQPASVTPVAGPLVGAAPAAAAPVLPPSAPEEAAPAQPQAEPPKSAPAAVKRTNGSGQAAGTHGVAPVPAAAVIDAEAAAEAEKAPRPPIPDDPGVADEEAEPEPRRARLF